MKHVFISYVRDNSAQVDRLCKELKAAGIRVWLDKEDVKPGMRWKDAIRDAIAGGVYFVACFSREYNARSRSYMNEELTLAIEELRLRPTNRVWFIPVLLTEGELPGRSIAAGEDLRAFQWVELYKDWNEGIRRIVSAIEPSAVSRPASFTNPVDGSLMELVPGGVYVCQAIQESSISDFYIGLYPITNRQYRLFLEKNRAVLQHRAWMTHKTTLSIDKYDKDEGWIGGITYEAAQEYCRWTRTRLLTLFELEYFCSRVQSEGKHVPGINSVYDSMPIYWTSTMGHEIGKGAGRVVAPVELGMNRLTAVPWRGDYFNVSAGLRCAAGLDMVKTILSATS